MAISATDLYDVVQCPHRVWMDAFGDAGQRDPIDRFVEMLWERGNEFERRTIGALAVPFLDLKSLPIEEKEAQTRQALRRGEPLIYGGRIAAQDLVGEPDLLRKEGGGYVAGDIKSGAGEEGGGDEGEAKPKKHYAVQLALYADILEQLGVGAGRRGFIWDVHGAEVVYDLVAPISVRNRDTLWDFYTTQLGLVRGIFGRRENTLPAYSRGMCSLCHWHHACLRHLEQLDDLTLLPELGRAKRDAIRHMVPTVAELANVDIRRLGRVPQWSEESLRKFQNRAALRLQRDPRPYLKEPVAFPVGATELFFDVEVDPMQDVCYLHGFVEREVPSQRERYLAFVADVPSRQAEERAFREAWQFLAGRCPCVVYHYSAYERTAWRKLARRYPGVATEEAVNALLRDGNWIDLYNDIVRPKTEWPTRDHSIKTLATYLGFRWRDPHPSGTASIEWYHRWMSTGDRAARQRILDYNEDDCIAMRVLLDGLRQLPVRA